MPLVSILLLGILLGPLVGIITLYLGGALFRWTGSRLGGKATAPEVRAAIAWSSVPTIVALLLYIPELALFGEELFTSDMPSITSPALAVALMGFGIIEIFVAIWALVIFLKCLGEVHRFSAWRAAGSCALRDADRGSPNRYPFERIYSTVAMSIGKEILRR